jgi:hypothetical protein
MLIGMASPGGGISPRRSPRFNPTPAPKPREPSPDKDTSNEYKKYCLISEDNSIPINQRKDAWALRWLPVYAEYKYDLQSDQRSAKTSVAKNNGGVKERWVTMQIVMVERKIIIEGTPISALKQIKLNMIKKRNNILKKIGPSGAGGLEGQELAMWKVISSVLLIEVAMGTYESGAPPLTPSLPFAGTGAGFQQERQRRP